MFMKGIALILLPVAVIGVSAGSMVSDFVSVVDNHREQVEQVWEEPEHTYDQKPEQLREILIECQQFDIYNEHPGVHYDGDTLHQHGQCKEV